MGDKDWRILKTIAEERNLTKAAARLYISQPALTYRLKNMEEEFGAQVVSRVPTGVELTPQGEYLLAYAAEMLH
ncbi:MAG: LysR family transcriptional regulator, partial [Propionivibrio sp.]|nr:LysR family transcriptional regulator [Propionivibrio sp.]